MFDKVLTDSEVVSYVVIGDEAIELITGKINDKRVFILEVTGEDGVISDFIVSNNPAIATDCCVKQVQLLAEELADIVEEECANAIDELFED